MSPLEFDHFFKDPVSPCSHLLRCWGLGLQHVTVRDTIQATSGRKEGLREFVHGGRIPVGPPRWQVWGALGAPEQTAPRPAVPAFSKVCPHPSEQQVGPPCSVTCGMGPMSVKCDSFATMLPAVDFQVSASGPWTRVHSWAFRPALGL